MWRPIAISLALVLTSGSVRASENYPDAIRATVPTRQPLPCTLCHAGDADGGDGSVTTLWGREMLDFGMKGSDPGSLQIALRRNAARGWDSDGDGMPDIEELIYGTDPSTRALASGPPLEHGCALGATGNGASRFNSAALLFVVVAWHLRRRRSEK